MNGGQDLGGMMGFGPVLPEPDEPWFHAAWEKRAFALTLAMGALGQWTIDQSRFARESLPPPIYQTLSYYQIWYSGLIRLMRERGLVSDQELAQGRPLAPRADVGPALPAARVPVVLAQGGPTLRPAHAAQRFKVGDRARARNVHPQGHTRLPRYARGHVGVITHHHGAHVFADTSALGDRTRAEHLYTLRFDGFELWGESAEPGTSVSIDAFEPYLVAP